MPDLDLSWLLALEGLICTSPICRRGNGAMATKTLLRSGFGPFLYGRTVRSAIIMCHFELDAESAFKKGKGPYHGTFSKLLLQFDKGEMML
jgi:hypothetical protein